MADFVSIYEKLNDKVKSIRANTNLSDEGRKRLIAAEYVKADASYAAVQTQQAEQKAKTRKSVESHLFGASSYDSRDPATIMMLRDARDRAARIEKPEEALALLESSVIGGDKVMARAILGRAFQNPALGSIIDRYVEVMPDDTESVDELLSLNAADHHASSPAGRVAGDVIRNIPKPPEIARYPDMAITDLAAEAPDVRESTAPSYPSGGGTLANDGSIRLSGGYDVLTGELNTDR